MPFKTSFMRVLMLNVPSFNNRNISPAVASLKFPDTTKF